MEFTALAASLLRRWYVVLLGLALTAGLVYVAKGAVPPTYSANGSVLLLPPSAAPADGSNPLLSLGGLEQPAALVVAYLAGDEPRQTFAKSYPNATYDIVLDPLSRGPLILIQVQDPSPSGAMAALHGVLGTLPGALTTLQDRVDAPAKSRVGSMDLSVDSTPTTVKKATLRAVIGAAGLGLMLTLVGAVAFDSLAARRAERRRARTLAEVAQDADEAAPAVAPKPIVRPASRVTAAPPAQDPSGANDGTPVWDAGTASAPPAPEPEPTPAAEPEHVQPDADDGLREESEETTALDEPAAEWPLRIHGIESKDFWRAEEPYGAEWPPRTEEESARDGDETRVAPRA
ncbi:hypothetical protein ACPPVS_03010 [Cellulomonas sp. McL0617]|uniref:hypothetical protein n=1 Tax=Cellulomonas sp. McL0617 TaxID=3415675 RepID=UPI003CFBB2ED